MHRFHRLRTSLVAAVAGGLLAFGLAAPAAAEHPQYAPAPFAVADIGEDYCTFFDSAGQAAWPELHVPERPGVHVEGTAWISSAPPGTVCLGVVPRPRQIEFTGYVSDEPVVEHVVKFDRLDDGTGFPGTRFDYEFPLAAPSGDTIEYLTVAICQSGEPGTPWDGRCGETVFVAPGGR
ncbi:hypothetical protein [Glycomyces tarimensis]